MRLTKQDKKKLTEKVRAGAALAFRERGYDGVSLDDLMKQSGLTRGAFYAHYKSKRALFEDVARYEHPLLRMLKQRTGDSPEDLRDQLFEIFFGYLSPENLEEVFVGCSLASLTGDITRAPKPVKAAHELAFRDILTEMARGQNCDPEKLTACLVLATGAVSTAHAMPKGRSRDAILEQARTVFLHLAESAISNDHNK